MSEGLNGSRLSCQDDCGGLLVPAPAATREEAMGVGPLVSAEQARVNSGERITVTRGLSDSHQNDVTRGGDRKGKPVSATASATGQIPASRQHGNQQGNNGNKDTQRFQILTHYVELGKSGPLARFGEMVTFKSGTILHGEMSHQDYEAVIAGIRSQCHSAHVGGKQGAYVLGYVDPKMIEYLRERFKRVHFNVSYLEGNMHGGERQAYPTDVVGGVSWCKCAVACNCPHVRGFAFDQVFCFDYASPWYRPDRLNSVFPDMSNKRFFVTQYPGQSLVFHGSTYTWSASDNRYTSQEPGALAEALYRFDPSWTQDRFFIGKTDHYRGAVGAQWMVGGPFAAADHEVVIQIIEPQLTPVMAPIEPVPQVLLDAAEQYRVLSKSGVVSRVLMTTVNGRKVVSFAIAGQTGILPLDLNNSYQGAVMNRTDASTDDLLATAFQQMRVYRTSQTPKNQPLISAHEMYGDPEMIMRILVLSASLSFVDRLDFAKQVELNLNTDDVRKRTLGMEGAKPTAQDDMKVTTMALERSKNWVVRGLWDKLVAVAQAAKPSYGGWLSGTLHVPIWMWILGWFGFKPADSAQKILTQKKHRGEARDNTLESEYDVRKRWSIEWHHFAILAMCLLTAYAGLVHDGDISVVRRLLGDGMLLAFKLLVWAPWIVWGLWIVASMRTNVKSFALIIFVGLLISFAGCVRAEDKSEEQYEDFVMAVLTWVMSGGLSVMVSRHRQRKARSEERKELEAKIEKEQASKCSEKLPPKPRFTEGIADSDMHLCVCSGWDYEEQEMCPSAEFDINYEGFVCKPKWGNVRTAGGVTSRDGKVMRPFVFSGCSHNILRAAKNRQCLFKGVDETGRSDVQHAAWAEVVEAFCRFDVFGDVSFTPVTSEDVAEWKARFQANQRARFEKVIDQQRETDIAIDFRALFVEAFVKRENTLYKTDLMDPLESDPRLICNGSPEQQVRNGPMWYKIGKLFKQCFGKNNFLVYAGGLNGQDMSDVYNRVVERWIVPFSFWTDCSRFDGRISEHALEAQDRIMSTIPGYPRELAEFTAADRAVKARAMDGSFKFRVSGTRKSGRNDTSVGNSLLNAAAHTWALIAMGYTVDEIVNKMVMYFMGDDNIVFMDPNIASRFDPEVLESCLRSLGWKPEVGFSYDPIADRANFLSSIWLPTNNGYAFVPMPERSLVKGTYLTNTLMTKEEWCPDVFMTHAATYSGIPVLWIYWKRLSELFPHGSVVSDEHKLVDVSRHWSRSNATPDNVTYHEFCRSHKVSRSAVADCEWYLEHVWDPREAADHRVLHRLLDLLY